MNHHCVPDWDMDDNPRSLHDLLPVSNQKISAAVHENELVELLWRNGHVVMQSQSNRKPPSIVPESRSDPKFGCSTFGNSSNPVQEDGSSPWFQYSLDDTLDKEFSEFFSGIPVEDVVDTDKRNKDVSEEGERAEKTSSFTMPPPKSGSIHQAPRFGNSGFANVVSYPRPPTNDLGSGNGVVASIGESSSARKGGSSACGSNRADTSRNLNDDVKAFHGRGVRDVQISPLHARAQTSTFDPTVTSSSGGGSGCSFGRTVGQQSDSNQNLKRKGRDGEESEYHSEEGDYESIEGNRSAQRSSSTRKSRAAEVHNLSERRRRDRINEKMKALQELIPHCNKSDKASMLDEAIEYLKSLQLQLQMMWMGSGMAPMMFPGVQQYMSRAGIGMGHASMPSFNNQIQLPRTPLVNHSIPPTASANQMPMCPSPVINPLNFPTQMQNAHLPESYARYVSFPHMQLPPQAMNLYAYGSHMVQQSQTTAVAGSGSLPTAGIPSEKTQNDQSSKRK